jgi:hypothetical protein
MRDIGNPAGRDPKSLGNAQLSRPSDPNSPTRFHEDPDWKRKFKGIQCPVFRPGTARLRAFYFMVGMQSANLISNSSNRRPAKNRGLIPLA